MAKSQQRLIQARLNIHARRTKELSKGQLIDVGLASKMAFAEITDGKLKDEVNAEYDRLTDRQTKKE